MVYAHNMTQFKDLVFFLEIYKFTEREDLIRTLSTFGIQLVNVSNCVRDLKFKNIEDKFGVIVNIKDIFKIEIVSDMFVEYSNSLLEIELSDYEISYVFVTPINYLEINNKLDRVELDAEIIFKRLVMECLKVGASDLHFVVEHVNKVPFYKIKFRMANNKLLECELFHMTKELNKDIIFKLIQHKTGTPSSDIDSPYGVSTSCSDIFSDGDAQLRITASRCFGGYHYVIRIQTLSTVSKVIADLGFNDEVTADLVYVADKPAGLTLFTGAQKTGKNTSANAIGNEMAKKNIKIVDFSSPLEVLMPFTQIDYMSDTSRLINLIRLSKKDDIDVVFLNEIPDTTVALAIRDLVNSSMHVITTFHINRIWHLPYKLYEFYGNDYKNIITQINGVFNQKMFYKPCAYCLENTTIERLSPRFQDFLKSYDLRTVHTNKGCPRCDESLRQPYAESLIFTDKIKSDLLRFNTPYEMEVYIKDYMYENKRAMEYYIISALTEGTIHINSIKDFI